MSVLDFDSLKVTTMTVVMPFEGDVSLDAVFSLLEITRIDMPPPKRQTQKIKIPFCKVPGSILSARYGGYTRGIIKAPNKKHFLNAITIDISASIKNVNIKLSKNKMQMCGATSVELATEAANHVISKLYDVQDNLDYLLANPIETAATFEWVRSVTCGQPTLLPVGYLGEHQTEEMLIRTLLIPDQIPETVDHKVAMFLLRQSPDFVIYEDYMMQLDWIGTLTNVISRPIVVTDVIKVMVNYNYDLGFTIKRWELFEAINGLNGFVARYENTVVHSVTIELPYVVPPDSKIMRRKDKIPCHTFLVYKSGLVTQSGPNEDLMREAYQRFNETINSIRTRIIKSDVIRKLKYVPTPRLSVPVAVSDDDSTEAVETVEADSVEAASPVEIVQVHHQPLEVTPEHVSLPVIPSTSTTMMALPSMAIEAV